MMGKCEDCVFWVVVGDVKEPLNECRRFPPPWPVTKASVGCGEYRHIPVPEDEIAKEQPVYVPAASGQTGQAKEKIDSARKKALKR